MTLQRGNASTLVVNAVDAGIVCAGEPYGFPIPTNVTPDVAGQGVSSVLWSNLWCGATHMLLSLLAFPCKRSADADLMDLDLCVCCRGTNYIMWYPFANTSSEYPTPNDPDLLFRYQLSTA